MVRALFHLRTFLAVLALGLAVAFIAAPGTTFAATACSEEGSGPESAIADIHTSGIEGSSHHGEHAKWAGACCVSGIAAHCCGFALNPADTEYTAANFTSVRWPVSSANSLSGMGPFGDFRPPKHIG